jgi:hypothetical protein
MGIREMGNSSAWHHKWWVRTAATPFYMPQRVDPASFEFLTESEGGWPVNFPGSVVASGEGSLTFRARGFEHGKEIELVPYYRIAHERYNLYWSVREPESGVSWG